MTVLIDDGPCTFVHDGHSATAYGAYLDDAGGVVYFDGRITKWTTPYADRFTVSTWHGERIGSALITGLWTWRAATASNRMASVRVTLPDGRAYVGRFGYEWTQAIRLRRAKA